MQKFSIEQDYLGEFHDAVQYDFEETIDYKGEHPSTSFYTALAQQSGGPVLELACGTGRVTFPIARQGVAITGLEIAPAMLAHARHKAEQEGLAIKWVAGDARTFDLGEKFKLIFMTGNAFQAFLNNADQWALLQSVHAHLAAGGLWAFETRNPTWSALTTDLNETQWLAYTDPQGRAVRVTEIREYDHVAQVLVYTLYRRWQDTDGPQLRTTRIALRYTFPQELNALLHHHGFRIVQQQGNWDGAPLTQASPSIITLCTLA